MFFEQLSCLLYSEFMTIALVVWGKEEICCIFFPYCLHEGVIKPWLELLI